MSSKPNDVAVVIGRFQPVHNGHINLFRKAAGVANRLVVIIGSAYKAPNIKDPFSEQARAILILNALEGSELKAQFNQIDFVFVPDSIYDDNEWLTSIQEGVAQYIAPDNKVALVGYQKDESSYYLHLFPQWALVEAFCTNTLSATEIRSLFWQNNDGADLVIQANVPQAVMGFLKGFRSMPAYANLQAEAQFIANYKSQFSTSPYPPIFVTVDAVVIHSAHVLLVQRKASPGKGLWALPGGFLNPEEKLLDASLRELREETRLKVPVPVLKGSLVGRSVFDHPDRSLRGRTITHAFYYRLDDQSPLPPVKGADDAEQARWIPLAEVLSPEFSRVCYEDHLDIIKYFV